MKLLDLVIKEYIAIVETLTEDTGAYEGTAHEEAAEVFRGRIHHHEFQGLR